MAKYQQWIEPEGLLKVEGWARDGLTDEQIAENIGITAATLYDWKKKFFEFSEALKKGKEVVDRQVENALLKRALGYSYTEVTRERIIDGGQKKRHGGESELTEREWEIAKAYFGGACCYCGKTGELTKDHLQPLKAGGGLTVSNIVPACQHCNSSKKDLQWLSWYQQQDYYNPDRAKKISEYIAFVCSMNLPGSNRELVVTKVVTKEVVPDTTAQIFWLKNRRPDLWRDRKDVAVEGEVNNPFRGLTTEELKKLAKRDE